MRTAESVLLTCWPPAPPARYVSMRRSTSLISTSMSSSMSARHRDRGERGLAATVRVERRDAHEPVHAVLRLEQAVRVVAGDDERRALDAGFFGRRLLDDLDLPALALAVADQHAHQHLRPVARVDAAGAARDLDDRAAAIELARQHAPELEVVERASRSRATCALGFLRRRLVARLLGELEQDLGIRQRADLRVPGADDLLELLLVAQQRLRLLLVVPEVRARRDRVELLDLQALVVDVKVTSGARPPCRRAPSAAREPRAHLFLRSP